MNYTVSLITGKPDCQALLELAAVEKETLQFRKTGLERQRQSAGDTSQEIEAELSAITTEIATTQSFLTTLPDGNTKTDMLRKFKKAEYKKFLLEQRRESNGVVSLLEKEYDIACVDQLLAETDAYIQALTSRMNALP